MKIYIAGKITGDENYKAKFDTAAKVISSYGDIPLSPAVLPEGLSNADYMRICMAMMDSADAVVLLPDWEQSHGATIERALCAYTGKRVLKLGGEEAESGEC